MIQRISFREILCALSVVIATATQAVPAAAEQSRAPESVAEPESRRELVAALFDWIAATNARDFHAQSEFYPDRMDAFYLWRNTPRSEVLAEKRKVFEAATTIEIKADAPQIIIEPDGKSARTYFRKTYAIDGANRKRSGEVLQELRWERHPEGWKIVSERDLRVIP